MFVIFTLVIPLLALLGATRRSKGPESLSCSTNGPAPAALSCKQSCFGKTLVPAWVDTEPRTTTVELLTTHTLSQD